MNSLYLNRKLARLATICAVALLCSAPLLAERAGFAGNDEGSDVPSGKRYMVTITNLTYNQIISPPAQDMNREQHTRLRAMHVFRVRWGLQWQHPVPAPPI